MVKKVSREWTFRGRYGDDDRPEHITISHLPEELDEKDLKGLIRLYVHRLHEFYGDGTYPVSSKIGYGLRDKGLVRQIGNGWYPSLIYPKVVHAFMKKRQKACKQHHWRRHIPSIYHREVYCDLCGIDLPKGKQRSLSIEQVKATIGEDWFNQEVVDKLWNQQTPLREARAYLAGIVTRQAPYKRNRSDHARYGA
jgi:hypothetical protein